jgi:UDP-2,4-diacetamido-2,4,6-trideoxy-beta-L-altropyranose hydrolase
MENKKRIYFRADAGVQIGYGHFIRSLALADMLRDDFDCTFFTQTPSPYQIEQVCNICSIVSLPSDDTRFDLFLSYLTGDEIVVLDNYFFTSDYQLKIKEKGCKLVCIDDMHDKYYYADIVINHTNNNAELFDTEPYTKLCLGFSFALLRKPFLEQHVCQRIKGRWFVSFGGSDFLNLTGKYISYLEESNYVSSIVVVIGDSYCFKESLKHYKKVIVKQNLSAEQMAEEMSVAEYAVLPSSSVCIEALACGCKSPVGILLIIR